MTDRPSRREQPGADQPADGPEPAVDPTPERESDQESSATEHPQAAATDPAPVEEPRQQPAGPRGLDQDRVAQAYAQHTGAPSDDPAGRAGEATTDEMEQPPDWAALAAQDPRSPGELLAELVEAEARRDEYLEDVRRARAEFENYRKRVMKEGSVQRTAGIVEVASRLLDVLDDFDRTLQAAEQSQDEGLRKGVELVYGKLRDALRGVGLERIDGVDAPFDPTVHEAVQQVPAEEGGGEPVVAQVLRPGYQLGGRVVRAAMVVVAQ